jgi:hypothetical protein
MLKTLFFCALFAPALCVSAQKVSNQVINSTGGAGRVGNFVFTYAVGEPITTTIGDTKNVVTQGFLQPEIRVTGKFFIALGTDCEFSVFPNPTADRIFSNRDIRDRTFDIYNDIGQLMGHFKTDGGNAIDVSDFAVGVYFIRLNCDANNHKILKFVKY